MNPPNQTLDDFSQFPLPHFTLTPPLPNPTSNPNFHPIPILNPNAAPPLNDHLISFPTPKKRRRGRPQRSGATSAYQFLNFTFVPELPQRKLDGIKRLGFGLLNKVGMLFPYVFWGVKCNDHLCHVFSASMSVIEYYLLKRFPVPYAVYLAVVATVAAFVGQHVVGKVIKILGRASIIIFILSGMIFGSAISLGGIGIAKMIKRIERKEYMGLDDICSYQP